MNEYIHTFIQIHVNTSEDLVKSVLMSDHSVISRMV